ncbi:hypothetical protein RJ639_012308, partial [Escallonia herrerae]
YLTDQLMKVQIVNEVNKVFHGEAGYGRVYYIFSNEHINYLITYSFDFRNEELLSYYISFLRAISGKLNKNTISLLVKTQNDEVVAFPLYVEAIRFAFHEESMVRTAVRALTLNVYHVGDISVNKYVAAAPHEDYFLKLIKFFREQCIRLNGLVSNASTNQGPESTSSILSAVDEIEDNLYYFSDVISAGIPDVGRLITDNILKLLVFPLLLPSLRTEGFNETKICGVTSLYILCCILCIVKIKDLANTVAAALFCHLDAFVPSSDAKINGQIPNDGFTHDSVAPDNGNIGRELDSLHLRVNISIVSNSSHVQSEDDVLQHDCKGPHMVLRDVLLSYVTRGDDVQVLGSLSMLATLLQTKELNESMLDALGLLPERKQHKKLLLQALVGEGSGEEQLFSAENSMSKDGVSGEFDFYLQRLKVLDALVSLFCRSNISAETLWDGGWLLRQLLPYSKAEFNSNHLKLLKAVDISCDYWCRWGYPDGVGAADVWFSQRQRWMRFAGGLEVAHVDVMHVERGAGVGGHVGLSFRQLDSYKNCSTRLLKETRGTWSDLLITVLWDEWRKCKRVIEASSPRKETKCILFQPHRSSLEEVASGESSLAAGERMYELVKVFVLLYQLQKFSLGRALTDQPPTHPPIDAPENSRTRIAGIDNLGPKPSVELNLVDAVPCRIAFERGKERHFCFLAISMGTSGWIVLAEELPLKPHYGAVRVVAPLAGCKPRIDDKHPRWLHLRIRPSTIPSVDAAQGKAKTKALVDGRWTLAFRDEESCKSALCMILEEANLQGNEVERRLKPLLDLERNLYCSAPETEEASSSRTTPSNSF